MGFLIESHATKILLLMLVAVQGVKLPDQVDEANRNVQPVTEEGRSLQGRHLLDLIGLGTGNNVDPYLANTNSQCLNGDLAECFKSQALGSFNEFFAKEAYP